MSSLASNEFQALTYPAAPTGVAVAQSASSSQLNLTWTAPSGTVTGYNIYRGTTPGGEGCFADQRRNARHDNLLYGYRTDGEHDVLLHREGRQRLG